MLLAIDTTLNACSAALYDETADKIIASSCVLMERGHAEALGPMIAQLFVEAEATPQQLARIAVTVGREHLRAFALV